MKRSDAENDQYVVFPIPASLQFSDSAAYNNSELGFSGSMILNAATASNASGALSNIGSQLSKSMPDNVRSLAGLIASQTTKGETRSAIGIATGTTLNKNIITEFTGVGTRQFSFQFKLISSSVRESYMIKDIVELFREGLYPEGNSLQLKYPPTWYIQFKKGMQPIHFLPKIFESYLTTMSTAYNTTMNLFHEDGSPVEVDIQLTFMESRALTLDDVKSLKERDATPSDFMGNIKGTTAAAVEAAHSIERAASSVDNALTPPSTT